TRPRDRRSRTGTRRSARPPRHRSAPRGRSSRAPPRPGGPAACASRRPHSPARAAGRRRRTSPSHRTSPRARSPSTWVRCYEVHTAASSRVSSGPASGQRGVEDPVHVVVLVKYVPEPQGTPTLGDDLLSVREGVDGGLGPGDEFAVEAGLGIVEAHGGEVTLVSMGPEIATGALRKGFSMGAGGGVLVTDPALRGADALATARVLAAAVGRSPFDLVLAGVESTDGSTGTLPMTVAELLGVPRATFARKGDVKDGPLRVERQTEGGYDVVTSPLPALVTVTG